MSESRVKVREFFEGKSFVRAHRWTCSKSSSINLSQQTLTHLAGFEPHHAQCCYKAANPKWIQLLLKSRMRSRCWAFLHGQSKGEKLWASRVRAKVLWAKLDMELTIKGQQLHMPIYSRLIVLENERKSDKRCFSKTRSLLQKGIVLFTRIRSNMQQWCSRILGFRAPRMPLNTLNAKL